jgi:antitoxin component YwqK of YwqJK toxin-antitoxin module
VYTEYYASGPVKRTLTFSAGLLQDTVFLFSEQGDLVEIQTYKDGVMDGLWTRYSQGIKIAEIYYTRGQKNGPCFVWNTQGILRYAMMYTQGQKTGLWQEWDDNGGLLREKQF